MHPDDLVAGRFRVGAVVADGGMGRVYQAVDERTGRRVALKTVGPRRRVSPERFVREAEVLSEVAHPAIVGYVAHGVTDEGEPFLCTEWVEGLTLAAQLREVGLTAGESMAIAARVAEALDEIHRRGLVHRDVKPDNILFAGGDLAEVRLIDFGIVRAASDERGLTRTGHVVGTLGYMAPEQARGRRAIDSRVDVFALGCVLHECLTGARLFPGASALAIQARVLFEDPAPLRDGCPEAPPALEALVATMLSREPELRPRDGAAVAAALHAILGAGDLGAGPRRRLAPATATATPAAPAEPESLEPTTEQRPDRPLVSLVLAAVVDPAKVPVAETLELAALDDRAARLRQLGEPLAAEVELLADGAVIARLISTERPADHAARAARLALALRPHVGDASIVIVTARGARPDALEEAIRRGTRQSATAGVLGRARGAGAVVLDTLTAHLLDERFELARDKAGCYLVGER